MNAEQKKRATELVSEWNTQYRFEYVGDRMAALLQELVDGYDATAESSSLIYHGDGTCTLKPGVKAIAYGSDTSANLIGLPPVGELQKSPETPVCKTCSGTGECNDAEPGDMLYNCWAYPDCNHSGASSPPVPSVPDRWRPFLTNVITAAGLLEHGKRDKGLAGRIGKFAFAAIRATHTPAESPADVVRDAERYRWLLKQAWFQQAADRFDLPDGGLQNRFEKCMDEFIDAAIERQGGE